MDWIFQANPRLYNLLEAVKSGGDSNWAMNQGKNLVSPGDRVFFSESGPEARLVAIGQVISPVYEHLDGQFGKHAVDVSYEFWIDPPLTRSEIKHSPNEIFRNAKVFHGFMGTNARLLDPDVVAALEIAVEGRLVAINPSSASIYAKRSIVDYQIRLSDAIKNARHHTSRELKEYIAKMDPITFEWVIRALLIKLKFADVKLTKASSDGGIDLRAMMRIGGNVDTMMTAVQVKRTANVGRPVVQALRGSLSAHESGLLVTSGQFSDEAKLDAKDPTKARIALLDGDQLIDLLLENGIGATEKQFPSYSLAFDSLTLESLKSVAAEEQFDLD